MSKSRIRMQNKGKTYVKTDIIFYPQIEIRKRLLMGQKNFILNNFSDRKKVTQKNHGTSS